MTIDPLQRLLAHHEITTLLGRYCMLFDDQDWDGLAQLWTDDAAFMVDDVGFVGRATLIEFLSTCLPQGYQSKHMISPPVIELADDGTTATARTDVVWISADFEVTIVARYNDVLVREAQGWRIKRRVEHPLQFTPGPPPMSAAATGVSSATMRSTAQ